jgi:hypothetical protein
MKLAQNRVQLQALILALLNLQILLAHNSTPWHIFEKSFLQMSYLLRRRKEGCGALSLSQEYRLQLYAVGKFTAIS